MAAAPVRPWSPPEIKAALRVSFRQAKPAKRENSGDTPSMHSWRPQELRLSKSQTAAQRTSAIIKEALRGEGGKSPGSLSLGEIKGVARRLSVLLRAGPLIRPSINGIRAAEAINEVKRKSALRKILSRAERPAMRAEEIKAAASAIKRRRGGKAKPAFSRPASNIALTKPPR